jgi:2-polyprenyl-3-methyl-5-hydroxy-6-metoxy-1,4-benzoquinol methylase
MTGRKVELHALEERYFQRMESSLGDKTKLLKYLPPISDPTDPPTILDVGAGGGDFAHALSMLGYRVTALDLSEDAIEHMRYAYSELELIQALANHAHDFGEKRFDVVICSSILHEVYSYGDDVHRAGHLSSLKRALASSHRALKPGGLFLLRDGVLPENHHLPAIFTLLPGHHVESVFTYLELCPFANGTAYGEQGHLVELEQVSSAAFAGNVRSVLEFAYTYTWGLESYPRETQELYAVLTLRGYEELLEEEGFSVEESFSYLQPGYPQHLASMLFLEVDGKPAPWFDSNAIWVARKSL